MRFYLDFKSDSYGKKQVDEIFGTDAIKFSLNQRTDGGGMARDISFSGGDIQFEFTHMRDHQLKQLLYYHRTFGFESKVVLTIELDALNKYTCDLDFATAETDDLEYFKCKGIQDGALQIIKRRKSVKVDVLSSVDIDGDFIQPLVTENMLLLAKPVIQNSSWRQDGSFSENLFASDLTSTATRYYQVNPCREIVKQGIEDTATFFNDYIDLNSIPTDSEYYLIKAKDSLKDVKLSIKNLDLNLRTDVDNGGNGYADFALIVKAGTDYDSAEKFTLIEKYLEENETFTFSGDLFLDIPRLQRGDKLWVLFDFKIRQSATGILPRFECFTTISSMETEVIAESISYNSVSKSLRLVDVMRQVIKSISGLDINAPRFDVLGQFYDNRLLDGNFLRGITDKGFKVSLEDIENSLPEMKGDYEIDSNGKVFFGIEQDFYKPVQSGFFDNTQFSSMNKTFNPKYSVNEFNFIYENYQSLKENEELNSADTIHGESKWVLFNKNVENKKEAKIQWTRDAFLIEATRRKALEITESTASQEDDTLFCIDSTNTTFTNTFTEVTDLQHTFDAVNYRLSIKNDGSINFESLGIVVDSIFIIQPEDKNAGSYRVFSVTPNSLELTRLVGTISSIGNGNRPTKYTYELDQNLVPFTNYTDLGFTETENLNAANSYSNRRYSAMRNIYNYWQSYLATCNIYWKNNVLRNTWYKNNGLYTAKYEGVKLTENADFLPSNPILTPMLYNDVVLSNVYFEDFIALQNSIRNDRGYIRTIDNTERVVKVYPVTMEYSLLEKELKIKGEEKFEPISMTIETQADYILVNNETRILSLRWEILNQKLYLYDQNRYRLYNGIYWNEVSINGAVPTTLTELKEWLKLIK